MKLLLFVLSSFLLISGCTYVREGATPGVVVNSPQTPDAGVLLNRVVILDESLQKWQTFFEFQKSSKITIESTDSRRTQTDTLEAWAVFRNRTDYSLQLEARISFWDAEKVPIEGPTPWKRVYLPPNSIGKYQEFSINKSQVYYYLIEVREGR